jgi:hypothetical protein
MTTELTDREILEACARACGYEWRKDVAEYRSERGIAALWLENGSTGWSPLKDDGQCARMENKCGVEVDCYQGIVLPRNKSTVLAEYFTPGNDAERRRASCLVVARAQLAKEGK